MKVERHKNVRLNRQSRTVGTSEFRFRFLLSVLVPLGFLSCEGSNFGVTGPLGACAGTFVGKAGASR